jgi:3-oxoadipate enol-lactonase
MPWAEVNDTCLRYAIDGNQGPWLVLVHEAGGCIESFDEVADTLKDTFRVVRYDQRGFGHSEPSAVFSLATAVDDLDALIRYLALPVPVHLAGCALGGDIAATYCHRHSQNAASLVITSPRSEPMDEPRKAQLAAMADKIATEGMRAIRDGYLAGLYPEQLRSQNRTRFEQYQARWSCNDSVAYSHLINMLAQINTHDIYGALTCETLVLAGTLDTSRPVAMAQAVADMIPNAQLQVLETGHFMAMQTPALFAEAVRQFINQAKG